MTDESMDRKTLIGFIVSWPARPRLGGCNPCGARLRQFQQMGGAHARGHR